MNFLGFIYFGGFAFAGLAFAFMRGIDSYLFRHDETDLYIIKSVFMSLFWFITLPIVVSFTIGRFINKRSEMRNVARY